MLSLPSRTHPALSQLCSCPPITATWGHEALRAVLSWHHQHALKAVRQIDNPARPFESKGNVSIAGKVHACPSSPAQEAAAQALAPRGFLQQDPNGSAERVWQSYLEGFCSSQATFTSKSFIPCLKAGEKAAITLPRTEGGGIYKDRHLCAVLTPQAEQRLAAARTPQAEPSHPHTISSAERSGLRAHLLLPQLQEDDSSSSSL